MALTTAEIREVLAEIAPPLVGGRVQKVYQPHDEAISLEIRSQGKTLTVYFSADPETARLHVPSKKPLNPPTPPPFCQLLRAHLEGARIERIEQVGDDRIVQLDMRRDGKSIALVAELTGRTANVMLLDEAGAVRGQLRKGRLKVGELYAPPVAKAPHPHPLPVSGARGNSFPSPGLPVARGTTCSSIATGHQQRAMGEGKGEGEFPISAELERRYQEREEARARARQLEAIKAGLRKTLKRTLKRVEALEADLAKAERYYDYNRYGELLKSHLGVIQKGATAITVPDYFDPALPEIVLPLDPAKSPQGNLDDYFRKYKKYQNAQKAIRPRLQAAQAEAATLRDRLAALDRGEEALAPTPSPSPLTRCNQGATGAPGGGTRVAGKKKSKPQAKPFLRFTSEAGDAILVGRNSRENEELTFGLARSHDLWLHASGAPGSHVVLRLEKGAELRKESLLDAATLALHYSDLRKSGQGEVLYAYRKHVHKPRRAKPGLVTVTQDKRLFVKLDLKRLQRLKESLR
jgi:predicted ribosome quality control (RQC) complex YloA/Tae2 family protein